MIHVHSRCIHDSTLQDSHIYLYIIWVVPLPSKSHHHDNLFLVGDPNLNLHLPLESWEGGQPNVLYARNLKHLFINGCFNWMIPDLYLGNGCFTKHPFKTGCFGYQVHTHFCVAHVSTSFWCESFQQRTLEFCDCFGRGDLLCLMSRTRRW